MFRVRKYMSMYTFHIIFTADFYIVVSTHPESSIVICKSNYGRNSKITTFSHPSIILPTLNHDNVHDEGFAGVFSQSSAHIG